MSNRYNFVLPYADTLKYKLTYTDADGNPISLDGFTAVFVLFDANGDILLTLTDTDGLTLGGAAGTIEIFSEVTEGTGTPIPPGCYSYYLRITNVSTFGVVHTTLIQGEFTITAPGS